MAGAIDEWTREENKAFEIAIATYNIECIEKGEWEKVSLSVPGKSIDQIKLHFMHLLMDVEAIESDQGPLPDYKYDEDENDGDDGNDGDHGDTKEKEMSMVP